MSDIKNYLDYLNEAPKHVSDPVNVSDVTAAGAGAYVAKKSLDHGLHRMVGLRGETHTTNNQNAKKIKDSGYVLDPKKGGSGASNKSAEFKKQSTEKVHITGYNKDTIEKMGGIVPDTKTGRTSLRIVQPLSKKFQKIMYRGAAQPEWKFDDVEAQKKSFIKGLKPGGAKTFHVVGSEDFYNKHFTPDPHDLALTTDKKLKVAGSKLGATFQAIKRHGLRGLKSSPITRPLIGASLVAGGAYAAKKLSDPLRNKLMKKESIKLDAVKVIYENNDLSTENKIIAIKEIKNMSNDEIVIFMEALNATTIPIILGSTMTAVQIHKSIDSNLKRKKCVEIAKKFKNKRNSMLVKCYQSGSD